MLVDVGFPEPDIDEKVVRIQVLIEELRAKVLEKERQGSVYLEGKDAKYYLNKFETQILSEYLVKYGWYINHPRNDHGVNRITLSCSQNYYKEKLEKAMGAPPVDSKEGPHAN